PKQSQKGSLRWPPLFVADQIAEPNPARAIEALQTHRPNAGIVVGPNVEMDTRQQHRHIVVLQLGRLADDILRSDLVTALAQDLRHDVSLDVAEDRDEVRWID